MAVVDMTSVCAMGLKSGAMVCGEWEDVSGMRVCGEWEDVSGVRVWGVGGCEWCEGVGSGRIEEHCEGVWGVEGCEGVGGCEWCEGVGSGM